MRLRLSISVRIGLHWQRPTEVIAIEAVSVAYVNNRNVDVETD